MSMLYMVARTASVSETAAGEEQNNWENSSMVHLSEAEV